MQQDYATALLAQLHSGQPIDRALENLKQLLKQRDHLKLLPTILRITLRSLKTGQGSGPVVVVANKKTWEQQQSHIVKVLASLGTDTSPALHTDPSLIGGFVATHNYQERDYSYKQALINLFKSITK